jgi:8-oxo-dGTP diphosphatase
MDEGGGQPMRGDGDGWAVGPDGARRWGKHGAAGLLLRAPLADGGPGVLLQHRAAWSHLGGTWALPGGARDSHETTVHAAVREAHEEAGIDIARVQVRSALVTCGKAPAWEYTTVVADAPEPLATTANHESTELRWVPEDGVTELDLHPGFAASWPRLCARPLRLIVDTANLLGTRPNGWWRDRVGATAALLAQLGQVAPRTVTLPSGGFGWLARTEAVLEGEAREAAVPVGDGAVRTHLAPGSGDDHILRVATAPSGDVAVTAVVTADRGLRSRLPRAVDAISPVQVLGWLDGL